MKEGTLRMALVSIKNDSSKEFLLDFFSALRIKFQENPGNFHILLSVDLRLFSNWSALMTNFQENLGNVSQFPSCLESAQMNDNAKYIPRVVSFINYSLPKEVCL